ncbi:response regulator [Psychroflexus sediminis]|uniref:Response regulator receiver domain-containing protein n=1 Tax=Psychroflexus sediminis TaxID=470826 RepID=A0A1G7TX93_9FLAO|nr:response regulator [Psychroflexus sediminis]SDG39150.1 Response regulator receiver domain-containing protein [Psychroflexus sediminis]
MDFEVLNVDDDKMVLFIHEKMMIHSGFSSSPKSFEDAHETITYISEHITEEKKFVIFLDVNMPDLDGWGFMEELEKKGLDKYCYIFVMTSSIDPSDKEKAVTYAAAIGFVEKPLSVEKLNDLKTKEELRPLFN